ncbi:TRAP transporter small permease [Microvirga massiliensis]|uniref:TRAP transporter small permease n=1 Tax=Microvirga massiliensis TaxID=1033741 RepID=UPI00062B7F61|nr:TRAP transporter small permease [Microvirga massiliensis]
MGTAFVQRAVRFWDWFETQVGGLFLFVSVLLVFLQIVLRSVFSIGISGLYEMATFCVIFSVMLTASLGIKRNIHVRIDILSNIVPANVALVLELIAMTIILVVSVYLTYSGFLLIEESLLLGDSTLGTVQVPMWIPQLIMPIGGLLMSLRTIERLHFIISAGSRSTQDAAADAHVV